jgi:hypothetical protein
MTPHTRKSKSRIQMLAITFGIAFALVAVPSVAQADPLNQSEIVSASRTELPVVAGTRVTFGDRNNVCTIGVVLSKTPSFWTYYKPKDSATRHGIVASHCARRPGEELLMGRTVIGAVVSFDPVLDIALVRIDPEVHQHYDCHPTSFGPHCFGVNYTFSPRGFGKVILRPGETQASSAIAMNGTGVPTITERYCVSGAVTGLDCRFTEASIPPNSAWTRSNVPRAAFNQYHDLQQGDSGAPVVSYNGKFYGIATDAGHLVPGDPRFAHLSGYVSAGLVFQFARGYAIAPAS